MTLEEQAFDQEIEDAACSEGGGRRARPLWTQRGRCGPAEVIIAGKRALLKWGPLPDGTGPSCVVQDLLSTGLGKIRVHLHSADSLQSSFSCHAAMSIVSPPLSLRSPEQGATQDGERGTSRGFACSAPSRCPGLAPPLFGAVYSRPGRQHRGCLGSHPKALARMKTHMFKKIRKQVARAMTLRPSERRVGKGAPSTAVGTDPEPLAISSPVRPAFTGQRRQREIARGITREQSRRMRRRRRLELNVKYEDPRSDAGRVPPRV